MLEANGSRSVETDLGFFSKKYVAKIFPIFSLSYKSIHVGGGIVDADYRGNIRVILNTGDRIAQVLFQKKKDLVFEEVSSLDDHVTQRGSGSFVSTKI